MNRPRHLRLLAAALALGSVAADGPTQTISSGGLSFKAPAAWKSSRPSNQMRLAQLKVEPAAGDKEPAELVVTAFPGGAGGVEANVERWRGQFRDRQGKPPEAEMKRVKVGGVEVIRVEVAGRYVAPVFPGSPEANDKPDFRLLGAIVAAKDSSYFLKMVGPDKTMLSAEPDFDRLVESIQVKD